ncbi:MAG: hypothetical protein ACI4E1_07755 [Lachnospira sp.]
MSKSVIYAANSNSQPFVAAGTVINFGSVVRRYGSNLCLSGGNVEVTGAGYYDVDTNFTVTANDAGTLKIQLFIDGVAIPGAVATITTTAATNYAISIPAIVRHTCCCEGTITAVISGATGSVINAAIDVIKL